MKTATHEEDSRIPEGKELLTMEAAVKELNRDERFRATVYAMNTLLIFKGVYSGEEFDFQFRQGAAKEIRKRHKV